MVQPILKSSGLAGADANDPIVLLTTRVLGYVVGQGFQRDEATEVGVLSFIDTPIPSPTELLDDAVVRDGLADQRTALCAAICWAA